MADIISNKLREIINEGSTLKVVASVDKNGVPHVVFKGSLHINEDGNIVFYELLESSRNEQNFVYSIWYDKKVAVNVLDKDKNSYEIIGKPVRCITCGKQFEIVYQNVRNKLGDVDLAAIWIVEPEKVTNESYAVRLKEEEENYPIIHHLDRLVKQGG
jgi:DNA-directed RNA polymerase subunit N (RpoN/RPB10)